MPKVGYKMSDASKQKMREAKLRNPTRYWLGKERIDMKGNQWNKDKPSWNKGKHWSKEFKEKVRKSVKKLWEDRQYRDRMVAIHLAKEKGKMELHYNWKGGISFEPYSKVFNNTLKRIVKEIDGCKCQLCGIEEKDHYEKLSIHHIDYDKNNCHISNLITLCRACNSKANYGREKWKIYFQEIVNNRSRRD